MVETQIIARGVSDRRVIEAMLKVPRHIFVEEAMSAQAYSDSALPIGEKQTISQPYMVALMSELLQVKGSDKVLEIGTGSGSLTMALAQSVAPAGHVFTFDRRLDLPKNAVKNVTRAGLKDYVTFCQRVAAEPFPEKNFDVAILDIPQPWEEVSVVKEALKPGGRVVSLNPTFNQIEKMAEALRANGFVLVESLELLQRPILAREGKTRPVQRMVSHTEFLLFGIKTVD